MRGPYGRIQADHDYWATWCPRNGYYPETGEEPWGEVIKKWGWIDWVLMSGAALVVGVVALILLYLLVDTVGVIGFMFLVAAVCGTVLVLAKEDGQEGV